MYHPSSFFPQRRLWKYCFSSLLSVSYSSEPDITGFKWLDRVILISRLINLWIIHRWLNSYIEMHYDSKQTIFFFCDADEIHVKIERTQASNFLDTINEYLQVYDSIHLLEHMQSSSTTPPLFLVLLSCIHKRAYARDVSHWKTTCFLSCTYIFSLSVVRKTKPRKAIFVYTSLTLYIYIYRQYKE